jgi:hypothetical protein
MPHAMMFTATSKSSGMRHRSSVRSRGDADDTWSCSGASALSTVCSTQSALQWVRVVCQPIKTSAMREAGQVRGHASCSSSSGTRTARARA